MNTEDFHDQTAGILLHPTSLPSGILDADVERWLDLLADVGASIWQVLPLGEPQEGLSPYQCVSAYAMNPTLLSEYSPMDLSDPAYIEFCENHNDWLFDYSLFKVLKQKFQGDAWYEWPEEWKLRQPHVLESAYDVYADDIAELSWQQYELHFRWQQIKNYATDRTIRLFGDMPLFIAHDSSDVWAHPERFLLDDSGHLTVVAGVPPDYYSETGQRWGNPHYNWDVMQAEGYQWWLDRIRHHLEQFDILRIDHFRGLEASWVIDAACETAIDGHWQKMPGEELLAAIKQNIGHLPIVAEDLGIITEEVTALRKEYLLPGMSVLQFGFDEHEDNPHKVHNIEEDRVVYTGTHDNDTTLGWFYSLDEGVKHFVLEALGLESKKDIADTVVDKMIEAAMQSQANICIIPLQDYLHLGTAARMNTPGTTSGNWSWAFNWDQLSEQIIDTMRLQIKSAKRLVANNG